MAAFISNIIFLSLIFSTLCQATKVQIVRDFENDPAVKRYIPTWDSLDARPLPQWYDGAKIGIFLHWGVFSVPSFKSEWFWFNWKDGDNDTVEFMAKNYPPKFTYQDFGPQFTAEFFQPEKWADLFEKAGAKYVVLTSKHHEGYTLWPSAYSFSWNSGEVGPKRDLLGELAVAVRSKCGLKFGVYHSWFEFFNPLYLLDKETGFKTNEFVRSKAFPELVELVTKYEPEVIWSDGDWEAGEDYWQSKEFLAWLYNSSPVKDSIVVNDRWGNGTSCKHGGFFSCQDRYNPGHLLPYKWENALTLDRASWGYRRNAMLSDYLSLSELITSLVTTVSCGGNFLINIGPTKEGTISPILEERLIQLGSWLGVNGPAIYDSRPWELAQNDSATSGVWYTKKEGQIFAIILQEAWPLNNEIVLGSVDIDISRIKEIKMLGKDEEVLNWMPSAELRGIKIILPRLRPGSELASSVAWTLVLFISS